MENVPLTSLHVPSVRKSVIRSSPTTPKRDMVPYREELRSRSSWGISPSVFFSNQPQRDVQEGEGHLLAGVCARLLPSVRSSQNSDATIQRTALLEITRRICGLRLSSAYLLGNRSLCLAAALPVLSSQNSGYPASSRLKNTSSQIAIVAFCLSFPLFALNISSPRGSSSGSWVDVPRLAPPPENARASSVAK